MMQPRGWGARRRAAAKYSTALQQPVQSPGSSLVLAEAWLCLCDLAQHQPGMARRSCTLVIVAEQLHALCSAWVVSMCALQLAGAAGGSIVRGLSGLDSWLEANKLLPELKPLEIPDAVRDEDGQLNAECQEVRMLLLLLVLSHQQAVSVMTCEARMRLCLGRWCAASLQGSQGTVESVGRCTQPGQGRRCCCQKPQMVPHRPRAAAPSS